MKKTLLTDPLLKACKRELRKAFKGWKIECSENNHTDFYVKKGIVEFVFRINLDEDSADIIIWKLKEFFIYDKNIEINFSGGNEEEGWAESPMTALSHGAPWWVCIM